MIINVQLSTDGKRVISYFTTKQDDSIYSNQKEIDASDKLWSDYYESVPDFMRGDMPFPE